MSETVIQTPLVGEEPVGAPRPEVTIVVPVRDERAQVRRVLDALGAELDRLGRSWEALLVYDGVAGKVWETGLELQAESDQQVRTIALHKRFGDAVCLTSAFQHARGAVILTSPQYVQVDLRELGRLFERLDDGAHLVTSWRNPRVDARLNRLQSAAFNWLLRWLVGSPFHDLNCRLRLIRRELLEELTIYGSMSRFLPAIAQHQGYRVDEVALRHVQELGGPSLFAPGAYMRRGLDILGLMFLTKFTHKPLRFFGALGGLSMGLGGLLAAIQVGQWATSPLFLLGVLFFVLGVQIVCIGLVGEIIIFTQARNVREYKIERIHD